MDDAFEVAAGATLTLAAASLAANDTDSDSDALRVDSVGNAVGGTVSLNNGVVVFTPEDGRTEAATFDYVVSDGKGGTDIGTVTVSIDDGVVGDVVTPITIGGLTSYAKQDAQRNAFSLSDGALTITGNTWKKMALPDGGYPITENTVLRFTYNSTAAGELNGIGLETNNVHIEAGTKQLFFGISGSDLGLWAQMTRQIQPVEDGSNVYEIDLSAYAGDTYTQLVFVNDNDARPGTSNGTYAEIAFVEVGEGGTGGNTAPVATDDAYTIEEASILNLAKAALLANDSDANGDPLQLIAVDAASNGSVAINASGRVIFTPDAGYTGPASFEYTVIDGKGGADTGKVNITILKPGAGEIATPVDFSLSAITSYGLNQDTRPGAGFKVGDAGNSLTLSGNVWKDAAIASYAVTANTVLRFDLTVNARGEIHAIGLDVDDNFENAGTALFQLFGTQTLPGASQQYRNYPGIGQTVSYEIDLSDFAGTSFNRVAFVNDHDAAPRNASTLFDNVRLVEVLPSTGTGEAPFIGGNGSIAPLDLSEDAAFELSLPILDPDTSSSNLEISFTGLPDFVTANGMSLSGTPLSTDVGSYTVDFVARDPELNELRGSFTINVANVNDAPVAAADTLPEQSGFLGSPLAIALPLDFFTDEDPGDVLSYSLIDAPAGLEIDDKTGEITGTPEVSGSFAVTVRATDLAGAFDEAVLALEIASGPPRESVLIEAEAFTGLAAQSDFSIETADVASGNGLIRLPVNGSGEVSTDLSAAGVAAGFYDVSIRYLDENDGSAQLTVLIDNKDGLGPQQVAFKVFDLTGATGQGPFLEPGNLQTLVISSVEVKPGAELILRGVADGLEVLRIDNVTFDPVDNAAPVLAATAAVDVAENVAEVTTVTATDPEGKDIVYAIDGGADRGPLHHRRRDRRASFIAAPNFEAPVNGDGTPAADNAYEVVVSASDGALVSRQTVSVIVTDARRRQLAPMRHPADQAGRSGHAADPCQPLRRRRRGRHRHPTRWTSCPRASQWPPTASRWKAHQPRWAPPSSP